MATHRQDERAGLRVETVAYFRSSSDARPITVIGIINGIEALQTSDRWRSDGIREVVAGWRLHLGL